MPNSGAEVVIIGGDFQGLGIARNLAGLGVRCIVVAPSFNICKCSNYVDNFIKSPPLDHAKEFADFLLELARDEDIDKAVIYPTSDAAVFVLSHYRNILEQYYLVPTPPWETTKLAYNKKFTYMLAQEVDVPVPKTFYPEQEEDLHGLAIGYPVILKPAIIANFIPATSLKAIRANNETELFQYYRVMASIIDRSEIMVQELIEGGTKNLFSFCSLFREGEIRAKIMAKRMRQHPMDFGTATTYAMTCDIPQLEELALRILRKMNYYGLSEVEFMFDEKEQVYKLLDINTRTWAWHTLGAKAGVNFSLLLFQDMHHENPLVESFETGVKWIRELTDVIIVITEMAKGSLKFNEYLKSLTGKKEFAVFSWRDPLPFFVELLMAPYRFHKRGYRL
jgi:predicted ATP-grasp superfamily ATP-dependent carboligase